MDYYLDAFRKFAVFDGRATRTQFWMFVLINWVISFALSLVADPISYLYSLAAFIPSLAIGARRLHDTGRSGWWQLLVFLPVVGWIWLLVLFALKGGAGSNAYDVAAPAAPAAPAA